MKRIGKKTNDFIINRNWLAVELENEHQDTFQVWNSNGIRQSGLSNWLKARGYSSYTIQQIIRLIKSIDLVRFHWERYVVSKGELIDWTTNYLSNR